MAETENTTTVKEPLRKRAWRFFEREFVENTLYAGLGAATVALKNALTKRVTETPEPHERHAELAILLAEMPKAQTVHLRRRLEAAKRTFAGEDELTRHICDFVFSFPEQEPTDPRDRIKLLDREAVEEETWRECIERLDQDNLLQKLRWIRDRAMPSAETREMITNDLNSLAAWLEEAAARRRG